MEDPIELDHQQETHTKDVKASTYAQQAVEQAFKGLEDEVSQISMALNGSLQHLLHGFASLYDATNHLVNQHVCFIILSLYVFIVSLL